MGRLEEILDFNEELWGAHLPPLLNVNREATRFRTQGLAEQREARNLGS